ncbi:MULTISPECIES: APC family permease [unclassified Romboutsia]|uniref:APC family permease n=1 Tax=unclassified Romboutsia TaxID=2626894 RepID=UPI0008226D3D|nr:MULTISPECIES: amino acid permease [unclassified Romboutsia]SCI21371.1 Serine/threonine exchanger SteT [uncultured Clostridium sp.]
MSNNQTLRKSIGLSAALSTVVGILIGSGVFFKPQAIYTATNGGPGLGILAWIIGGIMTIAAGLTASEISASITKPGGMTVYMEEIYGERIGFLTGWVQGILFIPAIAAALGIIFAQEVVSLLGLDNNLYVIIIAIATIVFIAFLNSLGAKFGGGIQTVLTLCKLVPLAIIIIFGFIKGDSTSSIMTPMVGEGINIVSAISQVLLATLFAYDGWIFVGALAGEMKNPSKHLPTAIVGGISAVMAVYLLINVAYLYVVPAAELSMSAAPATLVASKLFGSVGAKVISIGILISVFGTLNGFILTGGRIPYTMACEGKIPFSNLFSKLNKNGVPINGIWMIVGLAVLYSLTGQFNLLSDLAMFTIWIFYTMLFAGVIKLRKTRPDMKRPYKVPLYPVVPIIAIIGGAFIVISTLMSQTQNAVLGIFITLLGLPVYSITKMIKAKNGELSNKTA